MLGVKQDMHMSAWKKTLIAGLISYIDAGSIVAGASGLITIVWGFSMQQQFYQLWSSELFPVRYRATAQGLTFFITRFAAAVWGFAGPIIMELLGFQTAAVLMVGFCVVSWIAGTFFGADDRGKTLDEITAERYGDEVDENGWLVDPVTGAQPRMEQVFFLS